MTDREPLIKRVSTELNIAQRSTSAAMEVLETGTLSRRLNRDDQYEQIRLYMEALARSVQMIARDVDALYTGE